MTEGSNQGLFVIVGVVIFGIFIALSYSIFNGSVEPALANIFEQSLSEASYKLNGFSNDGDLRLSYIIEQNSTNIDLKSFEKSFTSDTQKIKESGVVVVGVSLDDTLEIPWNHKVIYEAEVWHNGKKNVDMYIDPNSRPSPEDGEPWKGNDNHGSSDITTSSLKPNTWGKIRGSYSNNSPLNVNKFSLYDGMINNKNWGSIIGFRVGSALDAEANEFKFKNVRYRIEPI